MQELLNWTMDTIRNDRLIGSWLEEKKYEWIPLIQRSILNILNNNHSVLIITDDDRVWFSKYILTNINGTKHQRPFLPFYDFTSFANLNNIKDKTSIQLTKDMLDISFPNGYTFWYIGKSQDVKANIAKISKNSLLWILDEDVTNSFSLDSNDEALDIKLLQMLRLYDKTLNATLFAQINIEG